MSTVKRDKQDRVQWNNFSQIEYIKDLSDYLTREYEHTEYNHYTDLDTIDKILKNREFFLSDVRGFNDKKDTEQFKDKLYFSLCFATGVNENLSLWYLYSGIDGKGGCISFERKRIRQLVENAKYKLCKFNDDSEKPEEICDIEDGKMQISIFRMCYISVKIFLRKNAKWEIWL